MEKIIKNTIEDFTNHQKIIEIEKLMLDKKYHEAFATLIEMNLENLTQNLDDFIHTVLLIICLQYIDLSKCLDTLVELTFSYGYRTIPTFHKFIDDILQKTENGYYEKRQIEAVNKKCVNNNTTLEKMKNRAKYETEEVLKKRKTGYTPSKEELVTEYLFNKFQK